MSQLYNSLSWIGLCFILSLAFHTTTQAQGLLTVEEAIQIGLENNFDIRIADNKQKIAAHDHTLGHASFLPTIDASLSEDLDSREPLSSYSSHYLTGEPRPGLLCTNRCDSRLLTRPNQCLARLLWPWYLLYFLVTQRIRYRSMCFKTGYMAHL